MYRVDSRPPLPADEPPAREGWPRPARWALGIFLAVAIGFIAATAGTAVVIFQQYPATVSIPDSVLGMNRSDELTESFYPSDERGAEARKFIADHSMVAQAYAAKDSQRVAWVVAAADLIVFPANDLSTGLRRVASGFELAGEVADVPPGELGGAAACVNVQATRQGNRVVACGWADHGSIGIVAIVGAKDRDEAARWMLDIREAVVTR